MKLTNNFSKAEFDCVLYHIKTDDMSLKQGYIGISTSFEDRKYNHIRLMKKGKHYNPILNRAYKKYDLKFEIIAKGSLEDMLFLEKELRYSKLMGWNIEKGGGIPPSNKGVSMKEEQKIKISKSNKGKVRSEESKNNAVNARRKNNSYKLQNSKDVLMLDPNTLEVLKEFKSAHLAAEHFNSKVQGNISAVCRGERRIAMGYKWKYKEI